MASLFISYSRKDIEAARRLTEALRAQGLDVWIDIEGIPPTVDWRSEMRKAIEESDAFLFLLSPDSCESKVCMEELEHAVRNGKRLIPVVVRHTRSGESPAALRPLNWILLRDGDPADDFDSGIGSLITAINTDYEWVQVHRQLQTKALEWERSGQKNDFLLRGEELKDAETQLVANVQTAPPHRCAAWIRAQEPPGK